MEKFCKLDYKTKPLAIEESGNSLYADELISLGQKFRSIIGRDIVFCLCENTIGALGGYISFIQTGIVPLMLDAKKDKYLIDNLIEIYQPRYLWIPSRLTDEFKVFSAVFSYADYTLLETGYTAVFDLYPDLCLLLTTSGSTGSPKLVRLSYKNIQSNAEAIATYLNITSDERPVTSLPMYYSYGISVINSHLLKGATILLIDKPVIQKEFWTFIQEQRATSMAGVPYTYEMLRRLKIFQMNLPVLTTFTQAGGKLNPMLAKEYIEKAMQSEKRFIIMYGQTEATARMSYLPWEKALEKYDSIGIAIPGGDFKLMDEYGNEISESARDGELIYCGANVSLGYAECREDLAKGDENKGVLHSGDIARRDEDGFYYITGRMSRFVKIYGNRVNLDATEQLIKVVTSVCACVGVDDKLTVFVSEIGKEEEIKALLMQKTGLNGRAFTVKVIDDIPTNSSGKIQYAELTKLLE